VEIINEEQLDVTLFVDEKGLSDKVGKTYKSTGNVKRLCE
jgi:hypothetical protein